MATTSMITATVGTFGARFVWALSHTDQTSADLELPKWIVYLCVPLGSYLMCYRFLQVTVQFLRTGQLPVHDHSHVEGVAVEDEVPPEDAGDKRRAAAAEGAA